MTSRKYGVNLGTADKAQTHGFVVEDNFLVIFASTPDHSAAEASHQIRQHLNQYPVLTVADFEINCRQMVKQAHLLAMSAIYLAAKQAWTYTYQGQILLVREGNIYLTSSSDQAIAGNLNVNDLLLLLTHPVKPSWLSEIKSNLKTQEEPNQLANHLAEIWKEDSEEAILACKITEIEQSQPTSLPLPTVANSIEPPSLPFSSNSAPKAAIWSKLLTNRPLKIALLALILLIALGKAGLMINSALKERQLKGFEQKVADLTTQYQKVSEQFGEQPTESARSLNSLKQEVQELANQEPKLAYLLKPLEQKLAQSSSLVGQASIAKEKLFYDLTLIDKQAKISDYEQTAEAIAILDIPRKQAYRLSISNKDHTDFNLSKLRQPQLISEYDGDVYVYSQNEGIFKSDNNQISKIVNYQKTWGTITDFKVFNGNIYLLGTSKDEIWKFTPTENGYSDALSYFQSGSSQDLADAKSLAIDFSVYVLGNSLYKFTSGARASFNLNNQLDYGDMSAIYKTADNEYLYLLDPANSRIVVINENGRLIKSIFNPRLKEVRFFGVFKDQQVIFVHQNKLYQLDN